MRAARGIASALGLALLASCSRLPSSGESSAPATVAMPDAARVAPAPAITPEPPAPAATGTRELAQWYGALDRHWSAWLSQPARRASAQDVAVVALLDALLAPGPFAGAGPGAQAALHRAGEMAPDDAGIAWLEATRCPPQATQCEPDTALLRLMRLEPDNAAVWLLAAEREEDPAAVEALLQRAARSTRYDVHFGLAERMMERALAHAPMPPLSPAAESVLRQAGTLPPGPPGDHDLRAALFAGQSVLWLPSFAPVTRGCRAPRADARRDACARVAVLMADSDTRVARLLGTRLMTGLVRDAAAQARWRERLRLEFWLASPEAQPPPGTERFLAQWTLGEHPAQIAWLARQGRRMPADWRPAAAYQQALLAPRPTDPG